MKGARCRLCGENHFGLCGQLPDRSPYIHTQKTCLDCASKDAELDKLSNQLKEMSQKLEALSNKPRFDKTTYQREYMRRRRQG